MTGLSREVSGWERLRAWFLLPAWIWMAVLFAAPFAIVIVYSLLTRGAYGGLGLPWTIENYQRAGRSAVSGNRAAIVRDGRGHHRRSACCWAFRWRCSSRARATARICICSW